MKKLFLASYFAGAASQFPAFAGEDVTGKKVVFIPTAGLHEMSARDREALDYINRTDKEALQNLGFIVEDLEISSAPGDVIEKSISNADCIFVCGGSTFFLLQELKRTGADKLISRHIEAGKLYAATSAGSLVLQKDIVADGVDDPKFGPELNGDYSALGFIDFYMYVHYGSNYWGDDDEYIRKYYADLDYKKLNDKQAVIVRGDKIEIVTASEK
ncbi:MAG: Type 1 glutamine amidotransferase-like domain-containing protein [Defluviitaleaceae bacterium]|nr:Type 1 glutamine amidotransferase-like domain-containing protein [Defluviitaleaceae bacterium]